MPNRHQGDILRTTFLHAQRQVIIRITFAQLDRKGSAIGIAIDLRTDTGQVRRVMVQAGDRPRPGRGEARPSCSGSLAIECRAPSAITSTTPPTPRPWPSRATALDNPGTVRDKFYVLSTASDAGVPFGDNTLTPGMSPPRYTAPVPRADVTRCLLTRALSSRPANMHDGPSRSLTECDQAHRNRPHAPRSAGDAPRCEPAEHHRLVGRVAVGRDPCIPRHDVAIRPFWADAAATMTPWPLAASCR